MPTNLLKECWIKTATSFNVSPLMWGTGHCGWRHLGPQGQAERLHPAFPHEQAGSQPPKEQGEKHVTSAYNLQRMHPGKAEWVWATKAVRSRRGGGRAEPRGQAGSSNLDKDMLRGCNPQRQTCRKLELKFGPEQVMFYLHEVESFALFSLIW